MQAGANKFDPSHWIAKILNYEKYLRLMCLLFVLGLLIGICYFVYARAIYQSEALVQVKVFKNTANDKGELVSRPLWHVRRALLAQFRSRWFQAKVAMKGGFVPEGTSFGEMREYAFPNIRVGIVGDDYLEISTMSFSPAGVREYPKVMVQEFLRQTDETRRLYREDAVERYAKELEDVRKKLDSKLSAKLDFEEKYKFAEITIEHESLNSVPVDIVKTKDRIEKMDQIRENFLNNKDDLDVIGKLSLLHRFEQLEPVEIGKMIRPTRGSSSPVKLQEVYDYSYNNSTQVVVEPNMAEGLRPWQELEKERRILMEKLDAKSEVYGDLHPQITELKAKISEMDDALVTELEVKLESFDLEYEQLQEKIVTLEKKLPRYHEMTREYDRQRLDYELLDESELAWDRAHGDLSQNIAGLLFGEGRRSADLQFAGYTSLRDENPISPNKRKLIIMGVVLGVAMALGVPFVIEMFDDTSATLHQLEAAVDMIGIGVLPVENQKELDNIIRSQYLDSASPHHLLEIFRVIRGNVVLHPGPNGKSQVSMVTSACPGEGKTTHAANLAWAFSSMGEKTLLIDCELRRGRIHRLVGIDNSIGLTSLLTGETNEDEVIQTIEGVENLTVIPRGPVTPGASELMCQDSFKKLMENWRKEYDRIVIDTPPVLGLSETIPLQTLADGVLFVVKADSTSRKDMVQAVESLRKGGAHFYGMVLNQIDLTKRANHYNYFYYSAYYYGSYNQLDEDSRPLAIGA